VAEFEPIPLILFSGLGADESVFVPQKLALPQLIVPRWPIPQTGDTLDSYSERLADELRPHSPCILGGASFGGIVALNVARFLNPLGVVLIGSVRGSAELPRLVRWSRWLRPIVRYLPISLAQLLSAPLTSRLARRFAPHLSALARQFRGADPRVIVWSVEQLLGWRTCPEVNCPIFHIHGARDFVLPARLTRPDEIIAGGGHVISLTHPKEVNALLAGTLSRLIDDREGSAVMTRIGYSASSPSGFC
jgi:pimeloyl-ACP methyl ester carboxylesterase